MNVLVMTMFSISLKFMQLSMAHRALLHVWKIISRVVGRAREDDDDDEGSGETDSNAAAGNVDENTFFFLLPLLISFEDDCWYCLAKVIAASCEKSISQKYFANTSGVRLLHLSPWVVCPATTKRYTLNCRSREIVGKQDGKK